MNLKSNVITVPILTLMFFADVLALSVGPAKVFATWEEEIQVPRIALSSITQSNNNNPIVSIIMATDGFNLPMSDEIGTTVSNSIVLHFSVADETGYPKSIYCYLDDRPVPCDSSPVSYTVQSPGLHRFTIHVRDSANQEGSAEFVWTVLTPEQAINQLIRTVDNLGLLQDDSVRSEMKGSLLSVLDILNGNQVSQNSGNTNAPICDSLVTFIQEQVQPNLAMGKITEVQSNQLTQQAQTIAASLGCQ